MTIHHILCVFFSHCTFVSTVEPWMILDEATARKADSDKLTTNRLVKANATASESHPYSHKHWSLWTKTGIPRPEVCLNNCCASRRTRESFPMAIHMCKPQALKPSVRLRSVVVSVSNEYTPKMGPNGSNCQFQENHRCGLTTVDT